MPPAAVAVQITLVARARSETGTHRPTTVADWGMRRLPRRRKETGPASKTGKLETAPVSAVNADHHSTIRVNTRRGPMRSPSMPLGISKTAYDSVNAPITQPQPLGLIFRVVLHSRPGDGDAQAIEIHHQHQKEQKRENANSIWHSASFYRLHNMDRI